MSQKMTSFYYCFDARVPVVETRVDEAAGETSYIPGKKLRELGLERYAGVAHRNQEVKIRVRVPEQALGYGLIELPEQKRHHSGFIFIPMDESVKDSVSFEVVNPELRDLNLLAVEYLDDGPGKVLAVLEVQREVAAVDDKRVRLPSIVRGEPVANVSLAVEIGNSVGTFGQGGRHERGRKNGRPRNHRLQLVNNYGLNTKMHRGAENSDIEYRETFFWPSPCSLVAKVDESMLVDAEDLVRKQDGVLIPIHEAVYGAHPELLRNIYDGHFENIYVLPEFKPRLSRKGRRELVMHNFPLLVQAWDNNRVSESLEADKFAARTDTPNDFYCCMGEVDQIQGKSRVTHACFGRTASIHRMTWKNGKRITVRDDKGNPKYTNGRGGYLVLIPFKPMFQMMAVFYAAMVDGTLDRFYEKHGLLMPDTLFAEEDWDALQAHKERRRKAKEAREREEAVDVDDDDDETEEDEEEAADSRIDHNHEEAADSSDEELDVGDWGVADPEDEESSSFSGGPPAAMDSGSETDGAGDEPE